MSEVPCRVFGPWREGMVQQVEAGLNLTVVLTSDGQCWQMGETGASGRVKWEGCKEPELVSIFSSQYYASDRGKKKIYSNRHHDGSLLSQKAVWSVVCTFLAANAMLLTTFHYGHC